MCIRDSDVIVMFLRRGDSAGARAAVMSHLMNLYRDVHAADDVDEPVEFAQLSTFVNETDEPDWPPA